MHFDILDLLYLYIGGISLTLTQIIINGIQIGPSIHNLMAKPFTAAIFSFLCLKGATLYCVYINVFKIISLV